MSRPLWNPNLDDGVKPWQKKLKSTWDALCAGKYDWAHLAIHLWPERVVPQCSKDRSLAIAHGLEEVFWVEGPAGNWTPRRAQAAQRPLVVRKARNDPES